MSACAVCVGQFKSNFILDVKILQVQETLLTHDIYVLLWDKMSLTTFHTIKTGLPKTMLDMEKMLVTHNVLCYASSIDLCRWPIALAFYGLVISASIDQWRCTNNWWSCNYRSSIISSAPPLISHRPYHSHACNSLLTVPQRTWIVEAMIKHATRPMPISPACPKPIDPRRSVIRRWLC